MNKIVVNKSNIFFAIIALIHFFLVYLKTPYSTDFCVEQNVFYIFVKIISFILIVLFWQFVPMLIRSAKNKDCDFFVFSLIYFIINGVVLYLIWPGVTHSEFLHIYSNQKYYFISYFWHWLSVLEISLAYNIIPYIWGVTVINLILESCIVGYCVSSVKKHITKKFYWLAFFPFCIPAVLVVNHTPIRLVFSTWLFVLFYSFLFANKNKEISNIKTAVLIGLLSSVIVSIRSEHTPLLLIFPIMVLCLKIFDKKALISFFLSFFIIFASTSFIQKKEMGIEYELHNLFFVYEEVVHNNLNDDSIIRDKVILKKVFLQLDEKGHESEIDSSNKKNEKEALWVLVKLLFKNADYFISRNIDLYTKTNVIVISKEMYYPEPFNQNDELNENTEIAPINAEFRDEVIEKFIYGNEHSLNIFYNPYINLIILAFLLFYGLIRRIPFYIFYSFSWLIVFSVIILTLPWPNYLYLWAFYLNMYVFLTYTILELLQNAYDFITGLRNRN